VIDNFARNHKLGLVLEIWASKGKLLVCAVDLLALQDKLEARQFISSLLGYAGSNGFDPNAELDVVMLKRLFAKD
jgi:hypothetical protein